MALVRNAGRTDGAIRIVMGRLLCGVALLIRANLFWAVLLGAPGVVILAEEIIGH